MLCAHSISHKLWMKKNKEVADNLLRIPCMQKKTGGLLPN